MRMAGIYYERQNHVHIFSHGPGDIDVYTWEDAERGVIFVSIETEADDFGATERSSVVISLSASDYPAFAKRVCEALAAAMTGEAMKGAAFS